jgi:hypothetical protein
MDSVPATYNWFGPGFSQWDIALMKVWSLASQSRRLQLRFEAQNVLNHRNAGNPVTGEISSGLDYHDSIRQPTAGDGGRQAVLLSQG